MKKQGDGTPILELPRLSKSVRRPKTTEAEAKAMEKEAIGIAGEMRSNWYRLGSLIQSMIDTHAIEALGFPNMQAWMTARLGKSVSNAFSALRSVRALKGIPQEKLEQIGERNAHALTHLPAKDRTSEQWIEMAITLPTKEFNQEVQIATEQRTGLRKERFKTLSIALPEPVYEDMCGGEKKIARSLRIDIETCPGNRIQVWEALAQWILQTDEETIREELEGI